MIRKLLIGCVVAACALLLTVTLVAQPSPNRAGAARTEEQLAAPVTVVRVAPADFTETVLATGSLVAREEILVGPEVEGLRVTEVLADEGQRVKKGDVLAKLVADTLEAQVAQNDAGLARATAAMAQAKKLDRAGRGAPDREQERVRAGQAAEAGRTHGRMRPTTSASRRRAPRKRSWWPRRTASRSPKPTRRRSRRNAAS